MILRNYNFKNFSCDYGSVFMFAKSSYADELYEHIQQNSCKLNYMTAGVCFKTVREEGK